MDTHILRVLDGTGDTITRFDYTDEVAVAEVRAQFDSMIAGGLHMAFAGQVGAKEKEFTRTFDPLAEETIVAPRFAGG